MQKIHIHNKTLNIARIYSLGNINSITHGKAKDYFCTSYMTSNEINPNDSIINISFIDGSEATYTSEWEISFK